MHMGIIVNQEKIHPHSVFSSFWGENILVGPGRKCLGPTIYFPSFLPNQTHSKKVILPIFSPKFSIYPISPPNKHTLRESGAQLELFFYLFLFQFKKKNKNIKASHFVNFLWVWLTSNIFLTEISFYFDEKLSHHSLTK